MGIPSDTKDQSVYHAILSDMHRLQSIMLNLQMIDDPSTAEALRDHFRREQTITLGKLTEWRQRRPEVYRQASEDFGSQVRRDPQ